MHDYDNPSATHILDAEIIDEDDAEGAEDTVVFRYMGEGVRNLGVQNFERSGHNIFERSGRRPDRENLVGDGSGRAYIKDLAI